MDGFSLGRIAKIETYNSYCVIKGEFPKEDLSKECSFASQKVSAVVKAQALSTSSKYVITAADREHDRVTFGLLTQKRRDAASINKAVGDNRIYLLNKNTGVFPIGLLNRVKRWCKTNNVKVLVENKRKRPIKKYNFKFLKEWEKKLRDYQREGVSYSARNTHALYDWATNSGKTLLMAGIMVNKSVKTLILTHSGILARQLRKAFSDYLGEKIIVLDGKTAKKINELTPITVAVINTAKNYIDRLYDYGFDMVMVDEAHKSAATSYVRVCSKLNPYYMYGFTGTAYRHDNADLILEAQYGLNRPKIDNTTMIDDGFSCPVKIDFKEFFVKIENVEQPYYIVYKNAIVDNDEFNATIAMDVYEDVEAGRVTIVQVAHKKQGRIIRDILQYLGVKVCLVTGDNSGASNYNLLERFKQGAYDVAVGTVINEGFDFDGIDVVVNAAGMKAKGLVAQKLGRVLRMREGKIGVYRDYFIRGHYILENHSYERLVALKNMGFLSTMLEKVEREIADRKAEFEKEKEKQLAALKETAKNMKEKDKLKLTKTLFGKKLNSIRIV